VPLSSAAFVGTLVALALSGDALQATRVVRTATKLLERSVRFMKA
jgi:hypothetical protein